MSVELTALYAERAQCALALARAAQALGYFVGFRHDPAMDSTEAALWPVLFIDLPTGQVSWHLSVEDRLSANDIGDYNGTWDRHNTAEKYRRLAAWRPKAVRNDIHARSTCCNAAARCGRCGADLTYGNQ